MNIINKEFEVEKEKSNEKDENDDKDDELKKNNDISTTKEDESFIVDEVIQYCSSPKRGLVSININNNNNDILSSISTRKNDNINIRNTITMSIAMLKKEIKLERHKFRSSTFHKFNNGKNAFSYNKKFYSNRQSKVEENDNFKNDRVKSIFNDKKENNENNENNKNIKDNIIIDDNSNTPITALGRTKYNSLNLDINKTSTHNPQMNKNISKNKKKKKNRKSKEKMDENDDKYKEKRHSSINLENHDSKKKKKKKKKLKRKSINKDAIDQDIKDEQNSPNIIILDFSSANNSEDSESSSDKSFEKKEKNKIEKENDEFLSTKQRTIIEMNKKRDEIPERRFVAPKTKNSCFVGTKYKMSQTKVNQKLTKRKFTTNNLLTSKTKINFKIKSINQNNINNKEREKCLNRESGKENKDKEKKKKEKLFSNTKNIYNEEKFEDKPTKLIHSLSKKIPLHNNNKLEKKSKYKKSKSRESFKSCKNLNKNIKQMIENDKNGKFKTENYNNMFLATKSLNNTPKSKYNDKTSYNSNRNLTKITINPVAGENKDIHLVLDGKQETIINYTNQEMIDDENEYMVECLKVLLKLNMEEQPRCKQKVNFNFPKDGKNKKIALFDLDETLVHCTKDGKGINGDVVNIKLPTNKTVPVGLNIRSNWKEALDLIKDHYHIVVYTASHQSYADAVLNYLDKENKYFQYRLYRNHCVQCNVDGIKFYVKDLDTLNEYYNLKDIVLIDNSVLSFAYHLNNGIPIVPFIEQQNDTQLLMLAYYLVSIANFDDLTQENKKHINIEHFLLRAKKLSEEESEEEDDKEVDNITESNNNNQEKLDENKYENNIISNTQTYTNKDTKDTNDKSENNADDLNTHKTTTKLLVKNSEKALKIAEDMKKNINDIYKTNCNEKE